MSDPKKEKVLKAKAKRKEQQKLFRKRLDSLFKTEYRYSLKFEEAHVFDDGKAYINVDLTKCDSPFSIYSYDNRINPEIYDYIKQETEFLPTDIPVVVNFDDDDQYSDEMKDNIRKAVIRHYSLEYEEARYDLHKSRRFALFCMIIGIFFLALYVGLTFWLKDYQDYKGFSDVVYIISWVFIWEAVDRIAISGITQTEDVLNYGQLALVEVQFGDPKIKKVK